ncbi:unnamed protein product [Ostreobium quekettii]|uniref:Uncharacterized protein n=1 Tax=Ostreobium quekettii TaxID=121088 RepID=A0A8S1IND9_9CHLO|nr:unnamed protein product [Ostreobium quekettii]|eukprot:evm.model.scf_93.8 EVM.evm.TU.scf_93.8   scf_93:111013-115188(-)
MGGAASTASGSPGPILQGKALLVACKTSNCYVSGSEWAGSGCEAHLAEALLHKLGFLKHKILMVANNPKSGKKVLTKNMLMSGLAWLIDGVKSGDHLVFYFSNSSNFTQADLCSAVKEVLIENIPVGATLHVIGDGAHSRNLMQLPHAWHWTNAKKGKAWKGLQNLSSKMLNGMQKGSVRSPIIQFTPISEVDENSEKLPLDDEDHRTLFLPGALTLCLLYAVETAGLKLDYGDMVDLMVEGARKLQEGLDDVLMHVSESRSSFSPMRHHSILVGELVVQFAANADSDIVMTVAYRGVSFRDIMLIPRRLIVDGTWHAGFTAPSVSANIHISAARRVFS